MEKLTRSRSLVIGLFFTLFFLGLIVKIYWVQVVDHEWLLARAEKKWQESKTIPAERGTITDRNGKVLAEDGIAYIVSLNPQVIKAKGLERDISQGLSTALSSGEDPAAAAKLESKIYEMATRKRPNSEEMMISVEVQSEGYKIDSETKEKVDALVEQLKIKIELRNKETEGKKLDTKDVGVYLTETERRAYPFNNSASHVLGYMDKWGKPGGYGLESSLNDLLQGTPGRLEKESDRKGVEIPNGKMSYTAPVNGKNVTLTLDQTIQYYVESAIRQVYDKWNPRGVTAIAANPKTGEILAMANMPDYNPNKYWESAQNPSVYNNNAVSYTYEPGSTFKLIPLAGAIEEKLFDPKEPYQSGSIVVDDRRLHDHNIVGWGKISFMEGLLRSSNVAFVKLGIEKLGQQKLGKYITDFGFGTPTGIDLPGEANGVVKMKYKSEFATSTYGQGLTVTAIQQLASYGAIANGGKLMKPYIIKEIIDPVTNEPVLVNTPTMVRQVVSEATAKEVGLDLEQVVSNREMGTGWRAYIDGYRIAGKTGTANIVIPGEKGYADGKWLITFAGFAPVDDPKIVVVIVADVPDLKKDYHLGGEVASPAFKEIISQSLSYLGVTSEASAAQMAKMETLSPVPNVVGMGVSAAKTTLNQSGLKAEVIGSGGDVLKQIPLPDTKISSTQRVYLMTQEEETANIPNLAGKSLRDALEVCSLTGLKCKTEGEGYVVGQTVTGDENNRELLLSLKAGSDAAEAGAAESPSPSPSTSTKPKTAATPSPSAKAPSPASSSKASPGGKPAGAASSTPTPPTQTSQKP
ncbi:MAG: stage sporulation protein [Paenibacillaceae bacterium]|nr:stage sporulation protein [Paenibacillaceae bacterium]